MAAVLNWTIIDMRTSGSRRREWRMSALLLNRNNINAFRELTFALAVFCLYLCCACAVPKYGACINYCHMSRHSLLCDCRGAQRKKEGKFRTINMTKL